MFQSTRKLVVQVTSGCNLNCAYCYQGENLRKDMSLETFSFAIDRWLRECKLNGDLNLLLFGGEPLVVGKELINTFASYASHNKRIKIGIQTNGLLLDDEWISIFKNNNMYLSVSYEGSETLRNSTHTLVFNKLKKIVPAPIPLGIISTLHRENYPHIISLIEDVRSLGLNSIKINRTFDTKGNSNFALEGGELVDAAKLIVNYMIKNPDFTEELLTQKMKRFIESLNSPLRRTFSDQAICYERYCGRLRTSVELDPDGKVVICGPHKNHLSVFDNDFLEIQESLYQWSFQKDKMESVNKLGCNICSAAPFCDGGCSSLSYSRYGKGLIDHTTCEYNKGLSKYFSSIYPQIVTLLRKKNESDACGLNIRTI